MTPTEIRACLRELAPYDPIIQRHAVLWAAQYRPELAELLKHLSALGSLMPPAASELA